MLTSNCANKSAFSLIVLDELASTNSYLKERCAELPPWTAVRALKQSHGRGRFNRIWEAVPGKDLTFSVLMEISSFHISSLSSLTPVIGLSLVQACVSLGVRASIKWPNDILVEGRKL